MPIKIPKTFARRKSSGNALDEVEAPASAPSFRVLERRPQTSKSFDGGSKLASIGAAAAAAPVPLTATGTAARSSFVAPADRLRDGSLHGSNVAFNRGSGGSNTNSTSTKASQDPIYSSRISSSSTPPSSVGGPTPDEHHPIPKQPSSVLNIPISQEPEPEPEPDRSFSFKAGSRTFSFGARAPRVLSRFHSKPALNEHLPTREENLSDPSARSRAMTESSYASTAIPPKLEMNVASSEFDRLDNIIDNIGKRRSALMPSTESAPAEGQESPSHHDHPRLRQLDFDDDVSRLPKPASINLDGSRDAQGSPRSPGSRSSTDMLLLQPSTPSPGLRTFSDEDASASRLQTDDVADRMSEARLSDARRAGGAPRGRSVGAVDASPKRSSAYRDRRSMAPLNGADSDGPSSAGGPIGRFHHKTASLSPTRLISFDEQMQAKEGDETREPTPASRPRVPGHDEFPIGAAGVDLSRHSAETTDLRASVSPSEKARPGPPQRRRSSGTSPLLAGPRGSEDDGQEGPLLGKGERDSVFRVPELESYRDARWSSQGQSRAQSSSGFDESVTVDTKPTPRPGKEPAATVPSFSSHHVHAHDAPPSHLHSPSPGRPPLLSHASGSSHRALLRSQPGRPSSEGPATQAAGEEDDDEDVPLGILAAHGFPSKARPPSRHTKTGSVPHLGSMSQLDLHASTSSPVYGEPNRGEARQSGLPVFARNLPQDPYLGSAPPMQTDPNAMGTLGRNSMASNSVTDLPPGGLIGVIAGEERNRALRRGNAGAQGAFGNMALSGSPFTGYGQGAAGALMPAGAAQYPAAGAMAGYSMPFGRAPGMTVADQAQLQMSQQMTEMMWMQMMWMQQMMQMQGVQPGVPPMMMVPPQQQGPQAQRPPSINVVPIPGQPMPRPATAGSPLADPGADAPHMHQRTMSMLDPSMSTGNRPVSQARFSQYLPSFQTQRPVNQGYASSLAPSERSNVGLPSRYRPVSSIGQTATEASQGRAATMTSSVHPNWSAQGLKPSGYRGPDPKAGPHHPPPPPAHAPSPVSVPPRRPTQHDDDDEDVGWEEMKRKREKSRLNWRFKRQTNPLQDVHVPQM